MQYARIQMYIKWISPTFLVSSWVETGVQAQPSLLPLLIHRWLHQIGEGREWRLRYTLEEFLPNNSAPVINVTALCRFPHLIIKQEAFRYTTAKRCNWWGLRSFYPAISYPVFTCLLWLRSIMRFAYSIARTWVITSKCSWKKVTRFLLIVPLVYLLNWNHTLGVNFQ